MIVERDSANRSPGSRLRCRVATFVLFLVGSAASTSTVGCARPAGPLFPSVQPPIVFPRAPDIARIQYLGTLRTGRDLHPGTSAWESFRTAITGRSAARGVSAPAGLAVSASDRLYVTDPPQRCLHIFDLASRKYRAVFNAGDTPFAAPADVAADNNGRIYVTDAGRGTIDVFRETGEHLAAWSDLDLSRPVGIAYHAGARRLYVTDAAGHQCVAVDLEGREQLRFGGHGAAPGQFNRPTFLAVAPDGDLLIADSMNFRIQRFTSDGQHVGTFGQIGDAAGDLSLPKGIAVDDRGNVYVADAHFENVQVFDRAGRLLMAFGGEGREPGRFWLPSGLFIDSQRRLWVADSYNRRIQAFTLLPEPRT